MRRPPGTWFAVWLLLLLVAACSDAGTGPDSDPDDDDDGPGDTPVVEDPTPDPTADTFCGRLGYVCTAAEVPDAVFERSDELLDEAASRSGSGASNAEVADWLSQQEGVVEVTHTASAVLFRVGGGQPTWLVTPPPISSAGAPPVIDPHEQDIVGRDTNRDNPERTKNALILSPFLWQFGSTDEGPGIRSMLNGVRDYSGAGGVRFVSNASLPALPTGTDAAGAITVADFRGWDAYDAIIVPSHGAEVGADSWACSIWEGDIFCLATIFTGERIRSCSVVKTLYPDTPGVRCGKTGGNLFVTVDTEFFRWEYSEFAAGLDKAIIYFGACETANNGSLAANLGGSRSEFFGWDNSPQTDEAGATAIRLFQLLIVDGLSTEDAYDQLKDEGAHSTSQADLQHFSNDDGLHIREITTLKNPMKRGSSTLAFVASTSGPARQAGDDEDDLEDGDVIPFLGQAGDGENDRLFFEVEVDGVTTQNEGDIDVTVTLNDEELGTWPLTGERVRRIDDNTVRVRIIQPVDFDIEDGRSIKLKATTNLPGDGESEHEVSPLLENPMLHVESMIRTTGGGITITSRVQGEIPITFEEADDPDELKMGESEGPLEYVSFELELDDLPAGCTITTSTTDGRLGIADGEVSFDDPSAPDFGLPEDLVLIVYPEIKERALLECTGGSQVLDMIHWFAGFASFHGGQLGGPNELDQARGGWVIGDWQSGEDGVFARKGYDRSGTEDEVTLTEKTTFEIRGPSYADGG